MSLRALTAFAGTAIVSLLVAAPAFADEGGEGLYGKTDDKVITNFGFGLMIFFAVLVTALSIIQNRLERRKRSK
jgi:hypothetical protein